MKKICMVVHAFYPEDPRVRREAEAAARAGHRVDVIALRKSGEMPLSTVNGVRAFRLPITRHRGAGKIVYILEYFAFFIAAWLKLTILDRRNGYDVVQIHTPPEALVFTAMVPKWRGARIVLDLHELDPELYQTKFGLKGDGRMLRALKSLERAAVGFADDVIATSVPFKERLLERGVLPDKVTVIINSPDMGVVESEQALEVPAPPVDGFTLLYHGTLAERYGLDDALRAVKKLIPAIPDISFDIYGRGDAKESLELLGARLGLESHVHFHDYCDMSALARIIGRADVGIVPLLQSFHTDLALPTKLFDYIILNVPTVISRTDPVAAMFSDEAVAYFTPGVADEMAARILELYRNAEKATTMAKTAAREYAPYEWQLMRRAYLDLLART